MPGKRSNGEGTLRKRSNGLWECTMMVGYKDDGTRRYKSFYGKSQKEAKEKADALLQTEAPLDVINRHIIPALNTIGADFEAGKAYLPQLLMSADAASAAFSSVKEKIPPAQQSSGNRRLWNLIFPCGKRGYP